MNNVLDSDSLIRHYHPHLALRSKGIEFFGRTLLFISPDKTKTIRLKVLRCSALCQP